MKNRLFRGSPVGLIAAAIAGLGLPIVLGAVSPADAASSGWTATLSSAPNPSADGAPVAFSVTVTDSSNAPADVGGSVHFQDMSNNIAPVGDATVDSNGQASVTTASLAPGYHQVAAVIVGAWSVQPNEVIQEVTGPKTSITLSSWPNPSQTGAPVALTLAVIPGQSDPSPLGDSVQFYDVSNGSTVIGSATVGDAGKATVLVTSLAAGKHQLQADMLIAEPPGQACPAWGCEVYSNVVDQNVSQAATTTNVTSSADPSDLGQAVTFTAVVQAAAGSVGTPSGTVTFTDGTTKLGSGTLTNGQAQLATSSLAPGAHSISAMYSGDPNFNSSTSAPLTQEVLVPTRLVASPALLTVSPPNTELFQLSATLTRAFDRAPVPRQTITFATGTAAICTATTDESGTASCSGSPASDIAITAANGYGATFAGSNPFLGSKAAASTIG